jgi:septal ring factor EnvC (AmiA/AmiB activator)
MKACRSQPENREPSYRIKFVPRKELDRAQRRIERQQEKIERLQHEADRLKQEIERLRRELEAALRASKRQAAPYSRGEPKANPKPPGRKAGRAYGRRACRPIPSRVDEEFHVPLPEQCPHCGGGVGWERHELQ